MLVPRSAAVLVLLLVAAAVPALADDPAPPAPSELTERVDVRRIEFSLLALDSSGDPVEGLRRDELRIRVAGRDVPIVYMEPVIKQTVSDEPAPRVRLKLDIGTVVENLAADPAPPNYYLFFIDTERGTLPLGDSVLESLTQFVHETVHEQDLAAVVSYGKEVRLEAPFTSDREQLAAALVNAYENRRAGQLSARTRIERLTTSLEMCIDEGEQAGAGFGNAGVLERPGSTEPALMDLSSLNPVTGCIEMLASSYLTEMAPQVQSYLAALEATLQLSKGLNGNLTVYAISHGIDVDPLRSFAEAVEAVFGANTQANEIMSKLPGPITLERVMDEAIEIAKKERASFFFIDPTLTPSGIAGGRMKGFHQVTARPIERAHESAQSLPRLVASETGGVFLEQRDVLAGLRRSFELQKGRYILGIDARDLPDDDDLKRLRIDCARRGVTIRHSRGLYMEGRQGEELEGRIALMPPRAGSADDGMQRRGFAIGLDGDDLEYLQEGDEAATELTLHLQVQTLEGRHLVGMFHQLRHAVPRLAHDTRSAPRIVAIRGSLEAPPGAYRLLAFVRNPVSERETLIFREIEVPEAHVSRLVPPP